MTTLKTYHNLDMGLSKGEASSNKSLTTLRAELRQKAGELVDIQTRLLMNKEGIKSYGEAMHKVLAADKKLNLQYIYGGV